VILALPQLDLTQAPPTLNYDIQVITTRPKKGKTPSFVASTEPKKLKIKRRKKKAARQMKLFNGL